MANPDVPNGFSFERRVGGGAGVPLEEGWTDSNVTLAAGDVLEVSGGLIILADTSTVAVHGVAAEAITGVSATRQKVAFYPALPDLVFSAQGDGADAITAIGTHLGMVGTTGIMELDTTGASTSLFQIIGLKDGSTWDSHARMLCIIRRSSFTGAEV